MNSRKRLFSNVHRTMNFRKISCLPVFTGIFLFFLGQCFRFNSRKCLFPSIHRSVNGWKIAQISIFLAFPGTVYSGVFQCLSTGIVRSLPPTVSHDQLATNIQRTKAHSLSQSEKQTQIALLILKMIYLKLYSAVSFLQTYNYIRKIRGQFPTLVCKLYYWKKNKVARTGYFQNPFHML